jgi:hypothetical protein
MGTSKKTSALRVYLSESDPSEKISIPGIPVIFLNP